MNLPNILSLARLMLTPIVVMLFMNNKPELALLVFSIACLTDILDGYLARKFNHITKLGMVLDPIADKLISLATLICLVYFSYIRLFVLCVIIVKEIIMAIGGLYLIHRNITIKAGWYGKMSTILTAALIFFAVIFDGGPVIVFEIIAVCGSLFALVMYSIKFFQLFKRRGM